VLWNVGLLRFFLVQLASGGKSFFQTAELLVVWIELMSLGLILLPQGVERSESWRLVDGIDLVRDAEFSFRLGRQWFIVS